MPVGVGGMTECISDPVMHRTQTQTQTQAQAQTHAHAHTQAQAQAQTHAQAKAKAQTRIALHTSHITRLMRLGALHANS
jgi:hypothetical protein